MIDYRHDTMGPFFEFWTGQGEDPRDWIDTPGLDEIMKNYENTRSVEDSIRKIFREVVEEIIGKTKPIEKREEEMATKRLNYIDMELEWLEGKAEELRAYCDANPLSALVDRMAYRETRGGGSIPMCIQTIEAQIKSIRDTLQDYIKIVEAISKLREREEVKKIATRGDQELTPLETKDI